MIVVYTPYALPMLIAAFVTAVVASYIWPRRHVPGAKPLLLIAVFIAVWSLGYAFEIMAPTLPQKIWWAKVQYFGIALTPYLWLWFAFVYSGQTKPRPWLITLLYWLALFPITTILLVFTNEWHGLVWAEIRLVTLDNGLIQLSIDYGLWFWAHFVTSYLFLLFGTVALLRGMWTKKGVYRSQLVALMVAIFAPWISNILFFTNLSPIPGLDLTPFAFTITVIALAWSLFSYQLINIAPIARDLIIEEMREGVLVINHEGRIVDINRAAAHFVGLPDMQAVGKEALDVLAPWPDLIEKWQAGQEAGGEITAGQVHYNFHIAPLVDASQQSLGHIITTRVRGTAVQPFVPPPPTRTPTSAPPAPVIAHKTEAEPQPTGLAAVRQYIVNFFLPLPLEDMPPLVGNSVILSQLLERAFTAMLRFVVLLTSLTLIVVFPNNLSSLPSFVAFVAGTAVLAILSLARQIKFTYRANAFLFVLYFLAFAELINYGFSVEAFTLFFTHAIFGFILWNIRGGLLVLALDVFTLIVAGWVIAEKVFHPFAIAPSDTPLPSTFQFGFSAILVWIAGTTAIAIITTILLQSVNKAWWQETQAKNLLQQERDTLDQRVLERTQALRNREAILDAVAFSTTALLRTDNWRDSIDRILAKLGTTTAVSRTYLFEKHLSPDQQATLVSLSYEWVAPHIASKRDDPRMYNQPLAGQAWLSNLESGQPIASLVTDLPQQLHALLHAQQVLSLVLMPIMVQGEWWGFLGFDDCLTERIWTNSELEALTVVTNNLGAAIERQQQAERLADTAVNLGKAQSIGHMGNWEWDMQTQEVTWSDEHYRLFGLPVQSITPTRELFRAAIHPEDQTKADTAMREAVLNGTPYNLEYRIHLPDGRVRYMHSWAEFIRDEQGKPLRLSGVIQDITERKEAEAALQTYADELTRLSNEQKLILDNSPAAIFMQKERRIVWANPATERILGYSLDEMRQRLNSTYYPSLEAYQALGELVDPPLARGEQATAEIQLKHKNGTLYWVFLTGQAVNPARPREDGILWIMQDITKRKKAEAALEAYAEQLAIARDQALEASQYKSLLLSKVSHELRTPLGGIIGYAELLYEDLMEHLPPEQLQFVNRIIQNGHHLDGLIDDLLDQAQIEQGTIQLEPFPTSIPEMSYFLQDLLQPLAAQKGLAFDITTSPSLPKYIMADEKRLRQIVINLVNNAIKFTETGGVTVELLPAGDAHWQIQVADTGPGIDGEAQQKIFDSFWQANRTAKGYGLGLSIVHQLVKLMGGRVWVESEIGQGSTFKVLLPLEDVSEVL